ncbi:MAG: hypothetical protein SPI06_05225 [Terrisporobacter sp.]|uniref:hypothetical protein n=1 Tax=Terrisporobacter sp. TaxID=1965305 RepID=UPI002A91123D|nr:hypothetical protein [Terrisporobacter sp.]MDY6152796.1 hypothetical protein [Terrisporobacter sp.]
MSFNDMYLNTGLFVFDLNNLNIKDLKEKVKEVLLQLTDDDYNGINEEYFVNGKSQLDNAMESFELKCFKDNELDKENFKKFIKQIIRDSKQSDYYAETKIKIDEVLTNNKLLIFIAVADNIRN